MEDVRFDQPVAIIGADREPVTIETAGQAVDRLLNRWPGRKGPMHRVAREALHDLFVGKATAMAARLAFEAAADEAEISIGGWHAGNPIANFISRQPGFVGTPVPRPKRK